MSEMNFEQARFNMIEQQIRPWEVLDPRVLDVLGKVPREAFVPEQYRALAFCDARIPLGHGQHMMVPAVEGRMLQALSIGPADRILEIGTGSGFVTACLAELGASVTSIELIDALKFAAVENLRGQGYERVRVRSGDGSSGWDGDGAFDVIALTGSMPTIPKSYLRQLTPDGRLFCVTGDSPVMEAWLVTRVSESQWARECLFETDLPRLLHCDQPVPFVF